MNSASTSFDVIAVLNSSDVATLKEIRVQRLHKLLAELKVKGPVELATFLGRKTNQVSDLLHGRASFGEKLARDIEARCGYPVGWLDSEDAWRDSSELRPEVFQVALTINQLPDRQREWVLEVLGSTIEAARRTIAPQAISLGAESDAVPHVEQVRKAG